MTPLQLEARLDDLRNAAIKQIEVTNSAPLPPVVYHYGRASTANLVLKNRCIWATDGRFLNDTTELRHASELICDFVAAHPSHLSPWFDGSIIDALRQDREDPPATFIASFSSDGDLLSQWRGYAEDGAGVALGFDLSLQASPSAAELGPGLSAPVVRPCIYTNYTEILEIVVRPQLEAVDQYLAGGGQGGPHRALQCLQKTLLITANLLGLVLKNPGFREENEWRILALSQSARVPRAVNFRDTRFGPAPYIEIPVLPAQLKRLGLGPRIDPAAERSFRMMLQRYECDAEVYRSKVTYR